jgi:hypothetical protein
MSLGAISYMLYQLVTSFDSVQVIFHYLQPIMIKVSLTVSVKYADFSIVSGRYEYE